MSIDVRELLHNAVPPPPPGPGLPELVRRGQRRRRRRRLFVGVSVVTLVAGAAGGAVALATRQSTSRIEVPPAAGGNSAAGVRVTLPRGWRDLARASNLDPQEVLVVGTAARPRQDPITGCPPGETPPRHGAVYLSLYEYPSIDRPLVLPDKFAPLHPPLPLEFASRNSDGSIPHTFGTTGIDCGEHLAIGVGHPENYTVDLFQDGNRFFLARIATVGFDPSYRWLETGEAVLKSLRVEPNPGTSVTLPPPLAPRLDPSNPTPVPTPKGVNVAVLNGTGGRGVGAATANMLRGLGYSITFTGNPSTQQTGSTIVCRARFQVAAHDIAQHLGSGTRILSRFPNPVPVAAGQGPLPTPTDCVVIIGR